jgi:hypothetical protein
MEFSLYKILNDVFHLPVEYFWEEQEGISETGTRPCDRNFQNIYTSDLVTTLDSLLDPRPAIIVALVCAKPYDVDGFSFGTNWNAIVFSPEFEKQFLMFCCSDLEFCS